MAVSFCPTCEKNFGIFRWRRHCYECNGVRCSACLAQAPEQDWLCEERLDVAQGDGHCKSCLSSIVKPFVRRYKDALKRASTVDHWSAPYAFDGPQRSLTSDEFKDRADAIKQLQVTAAFMGFELLIEVKTAHRLERQSEPSNTGDGTHYYNEPDIAPPR